MCGRFTFREFDEQFVFRLQASKMGDLKPRFNIAPSQSVLAVRGEPPELSTLRWGLIPSWAKDASVGYKMINARAETLIEKPSFKNAFLKRRCLILADGFYEWQKQEKIKQPFFITLKNRRVFAFGGLWEFWKSKEGEVIESCTIITTVANDLIRSIHDRMPVIILEENYQPWLNPEEKDLEFLKSLLKPFDSNQMEAYPISTYVNKPSNDDANCLKREALPS